MSVVTPWYNVSYVLCWENKRYFFLSFFLSFFLVPKNRNHFYVKSKARGNSRSAAEFILDDIFPWKRWRRTGERYEDDALDSCRVPGARFPPFPPLPWDAPLPPREVAPPLQAGRGPQSQQVDRPAAEPAAPPDLGTGRLIFRVSRWPWPRPNNRKRQYKNISGRGKLPWKCPWVVKTILLLLYWKGIVAHFLVG